MLNYVHLSEDEEVTSLVASAFPYSVPRTVTPSVIRNQSSTRLLPQALDKKHCCISTSSAVLWIITYASSSFTSRRQSSSFTVPKITAAASYATVTSATRKQSSPSAVLRITSALTESITSRNRSPGAVIPRSHWRGTTRQKQKHSTN